MELQDPYGGGYWNTRDRWQQREANEADTAYKLALIAQGEREAQEAARLAPYEAQKRALELEGMQGKLGRERLKTEREKNDYARQRIGPIVAAHARGELPEIAARSAIEQEILRARAEFGLGDAEVQTLLQAGPKEWGMYLDQSLPVKDQMAAPPNPVSIYAGDRVTQKQWDRRRQGWDVVGEGPRFNEKAGTNVTVNLPPQEKAFETELGKGQAKALIEGRQTATEAAEMLYTINNGKQLLDSGIVSGFGAETIVKFGQALKRFGFDVGGDAVTNSQAYAANMAMNVGKLIKQFGAGTGLSDADREYAEKMAGGKITLDEAALRKILDLNERAAMNVVSLHNKRAEGINTNIPLAVEVPTFGNKPPEGVPAEIWGAMTPEERALWQK